MTAGKQSPLQIAHEEAFGQRPADLRTGGGHGGGHDGVQEDGDVGERLGEMVEHAVETGGLLDDLSASTIRSRKGCAPKALPSYCQALAAPHFGMQRSQTQAALVAGGAGTV